MYVHRWGELGCEHREEREENKTEKDGGKDLSISRNTHINIYKYRERERDVGKE